MNLFCEKIKSRELIYAGDLIRSQKIEIYNETCEYLICNSSEENRLKFIREFIEKYY
jgi:hypothetical protein